MNNHRATKFCLLPFAFCLLCALPAFAKTTLHKPISTGKDYYIVFPKAAWGNQSVGVLVNSPSVQKVTVTVGAGKGIINFTDPRTTKYYGGQFKIENMPGKVLRSEATRIQSPDPISVHGQFGISGISGTYTAMPVPSWGKEYYVVDAMEGTNEDYYYYPTIYSVPMVTIIGAYVGTKVTITPTAITAHTTGFGDSAGVPFSITLNAGDVYNITTAGDPQAGFHIQSPCQADLSGTHIIATHPVGVLVSQSHTTWPCGYNECGDYGVEWLPPVENWDSLFVISPSVQRLNDMAGEQLRIVFGYDGTDLTVDDGLTAPRLVGTYAAGDVLDYKSPISGAIILSGSKPFQPMIMTQKPAACQAGTSGGENWTFGMVMINGAHQWGDYVPFSSVIGSQSIANICFKFSDAPHLKFNGKRLLEQFPIVKHLPQGFAMIPMGINSGTYNEVTGDSGATAGGSIFGFGTLRFSPGGDNGARVQDPEVIKSFCHPVGISGVHTTMNDDIAPGIVVKTSCGHWDITVSDSSDVGIATGIFDISLVKSDRPPDTSFNVQFTSTPKYSYGVLAVQCGIDVINLSQAAQAMVRVRDGAGNEFDTLLVFEPEQVAATVDLVSKGSIIAKDSARCVITLVNRFSAPILYSSFRLKYGAAHHWQILSPAAGTVITIQPKDSVVFTLLYTVPKDSFFVVDTDTLMMTSCKEYPIAAVIARTKLPAIYTTCYDFGELVIDTLGQHGESQSSSGPSGEMMWVANVGTDVLHITGLAFRGSTTPGDTAYPLTDYTLMAAHDHNHPTLPLTPTVKSPWTLTSDDTIFLDVSAHPHHSGARPAYLHFESDGKGLLDSACLTVSGVVPTILVGDIDYGRQLYGTTADSFFVVHNTGRDTFHIPPNGFDHGSSADSSSFVLHPYRDQTSHSFVYYDITADNDFRPGDTERVPYRFIAQNIGQHTLPLTVINTSGLQPIVKLTATVVQPHISGLSACIPDGWHVGDTISTIFMLHNSGDDMLNIENFEFAGARSDEWTIIKIRVPGSDLTLTAPPWEFPLRSASDSTGEKAYVTLQWIPKVDSAPSAVVRIIGTDALGRHASDSVGSLFYSWHIFPYDTVMPIVNLPCLTGIDHQPIAAPTQNILWPNYPNPFSSSTTLSYTLGTSGHVMLRVVNALGETVSILENAHQSAGTYSVTARGAGLRAGMYFVEMVSGGERTARKIIVVQ